MAKLLVVDTETGGMDPQVHSILSLAGIIWEDGVIKAEHEVLILEEPLVVTPQALEVNRINLVEHAKRALAPAEAINRFHTFIEASFTSTEAAINGGVVLVGHNVGFDIGFLRRLCTLTKTPFERMFSHRSLDTASVLRFLHLLGKVPVSATSSSGGFAHFGIDVPQRQRHTALGDARATAELLSRMLALMDKDDHAPRHLLIG